MSAARLEFYAEDFSSQESPALNQINRETNISQPFPRMLSGHIQGRLLSMISHMIKPARILEIGTFTGYSAICLSEGLAENGVLETIEVNEELEDRLMLNFRNAEAENKIKLHIGHALEVLPLLPGPFDLVFLDADKENYLNYYQIIFEKLKPGGFILADNVLWGGKVLGVPPAADKESWGIIRFNEFVKNDPRVEKILLPYRDGLFLIRKR